MFALVLLAQIVAAPTPAATPAPTTVASPAPTRAVGSSGGVVSGAPRTLADVARERKEGKKGVEGGTLSVAGKSGSPDAVSRASSPPPETPDSPEWARIRAAQAEVDAARRDVDETASRAGMTSEETARARARYQQASKRLSEAWEALSRSGK